LIGDAAVLSAVGFVMKPNVVLDKCAKAIRHVCPGLSGQTCMECFERWAMELQLANACDLQPNSKGGLPKTMLSIMQGCGSGFLFDMHTGESRARSLHEPSAVFERLLDVKNHANAVAAIAIVLCSDVST